MHRLSERIARTRDMLENLGPLPSLHYVTHKLRERYGKPATEPARVYSKHSASALHFRPGTSDLDVFRQIFIDREYRCLDHVRAPRLIIDCGANVGYSSAYFLSRFLEAQLIAVEPDPDNFALLETNLQPFRARYRALQSGVWSHATRLSLADAEWGDGRAWARTVREAAPDEPALLAVDLGSLLAASGFERISVLKIDIEGAEEVVFSSNYDAWLDKVDNLVIELHGPRCERTFAQAVQGRGFAISRCDELTVCRREPAYA